MEMERWKLPFDIGIYIKIIQRKKLVAFSIVMMSILHLCQAQPIYSTESFLSSTKTKKDISTAYEATSIMVYTTKVIATDKMPNNSLETLVPENTTLPIILPKSTITTTTSTIQTTFKIHNVTSTQGMSSITTPSFSSSRLSSYSTSPTKFTTGSDISTDISSTASSDKSTELSTELTSLSSETSMASSQSSSDTTISFETTHTLSTSKRTLLTSSGMTTVISTIYSSTLSVISDSSVSYKTSDITKTSSETSIITKSPSSSYTTDSGSSATASSFTKVTEITMSPSLPKTSPTDTVKPDSSSVSFAPSVTSNVTELTEITSTPKPGTQTRFTTKSALSSSSTVSGTTTTVSSSTKVTVITVSSVVPETSPIDISTPDSSSISFAPSITPNVTQLTEITLTAGPATGSRFTTKSTISSHITDIQTKSFTLSSTKVTDITISSPFPKTSQIDNSTTGSTSISFAPSRASYLTKLTELTSTAEPATGTRFTTQSVVSSNKTDLQTTMITPSSTKVTDITISSHLPETSSIVISTPKSSSISFVPSITSNVTKLTAVTSTAEPATGTRFTTTADLSSHKTDTGTTKTISVSTKITRITVSSLVHETSPIDISTAGSSSISFVPSITSNVTKLTAITSTAEPATRTQFITTFTPSSHKTDAGTTKIISVSTDVTRITVSSIATGTSPIEYSTVGPSSISIVPSITSNVTQRTAITSTTEPATITRFTTKSTASSYKTDTGTTEIISISTKVTGITESSLVPETSPIDISTAGSSTISFVPSITSNVTQLTAITSTAEPATGTRFTTQSPPSSPKTDSGTTEIISISTKVTGITESSLFPETSPIDISTAGSSSISFVPSITSNVTQRTAITSTAEPATGTRFTTKSTPSSPKTDSGTTEIISISTKVTGITESSPVPETSSIDISTAGSSSISFVPSITSNVTQLTAITSTAEPATGTRFTTKSAPSSPKTDAGTTEIISISTKVTGITESSFVPETSSIDISTAGSSSISFVPSITSNVTQLTAITSTAEPATITRFTTQSPPSSSKTDSGTTEIISISTKVTEITESSLVPETSPIDISTTGSSSISFVPSITSNITQLTAITSTAEPATGTRFTTKSTPSSYKTDSGTTEIISISTKVTGIIESSPVPETSPIDISTTGSSSISFVPSITSNVTQLTAITSTAEPATETRFTTQSPLSSDKTDSGTTEIISISTKVTGITESSPVSETSPIDISTAGSSSISFVPSITSNVTQLTAITSTAEPATGTRFTTQSPPSSSKTDSGTTEIISISTKVTGITESSVVPETSPIDISTAGSSSISFVPSITSNVTQRTAIKSTAEPATITRFTTKSTASSYKTDTGTTEIISISTKVTESSLVPETSPIDISTTGSSSISFVPSITSNITQLTAITSTAELATGTRFTTKSTPSSPKTDSGTTEIISISTKVTGITESSPVPETSPIDISTAGSSSISFVPSITSNVTQRTAITSTAEPATGTRYTTQSPPSSTKTDSGTTEIISISTKVTGITESSLVPETSPIDISTAGSSSFSFVPSITSNVTQLTAITSTAEPATGTRFTTQSPPSSPITDSGTTEIISISTKVTGITESSVVPKTSPINISTAGSSSISFVPSITSNVTKLTAITSTAESATSTRFTTESASSSHKTDLETTEIISISTKVTGITESSLVPKTSPIDISTAGSSSFSFVPSITSNVTQLTAITSTAEPATGTRFTTKSAPSSYKTDTGTTEIISISTKVTGITESSLVPETSPIDISTAGSSSISFVPTITSNVTKLTAITSTAEPATGTRFTTQSTPSSPKTHTGTTEIISISTKVTGITESSLVPETSPIDISTAGSSSISFVPSITSNVTQLTAITSTAEPATITRFTTQSAPSSPKTDSGTTEIISISTKVTGITESSLVPKTSPIDISTAGSSSISFVPSITSNVTQLTAITSTAEPATITRFTTQSAPSSPKTDSGTTEIISISTKVTGITESSLVPKTSPIDISTAGSSSISFVPSITSNVTQLTAITSTAEPATITRFTTQSTPSSPKTDSGTTEIISISTKVTGITESSVVPETSPIDISTTGLSSISFVPSITSNVTQLTAITSTAEPATGTRFTTKSAPSSYKTDTGTTEIISASTKVTGITESSVLPETSPIDISTPGSSSFSFVPSITSNVTQLTAITTTAEPATSTRFTTTSAPSSYKTDTGTTEIISASTKVTGISISSLVPETSSIDISTAGPSSFSFVPSITSNVTQLTAITSTAEPATGTRFTTTFAPSSHKTDSGTTKIISISTKVTGITETSLVPETSPIDISTAGSSTISFVPSITSNVTQLTEITSTAEPATGTRFTTKSAPSSYKTDTGTTEIISASTKVTGITESSLVPETSPIDISTAGSSSISFVPSITSNVTQLTAITSTAEPATGTRFTTKSAPSSYKTDTGTTEIISASTKVTGITESSLVPETSPIDISTAGSSSISFVPSITSNVTQRTSMTSTAEPATGTRFTTKSAPSSYKTDTGTTEIISASTKVTGISISSLVPETSPIDISTPGSSSFSFVPSITSNVTQLTAITTTAEPATGTRFTTKSAPSSYKTDTGTTEIISASTKVTGISISSLVPETSSIDISTAGPSSFSFVPPITSNVTQLTAITSTAEPATGTRFTTKSAPSSYKTDTGTTEIISISTKVTGITESSVLPETSPIDISTPGSSSFSFVPSITSNVTQLTAITTTAEPATITRFTTQSAPSSYKTDSGTTEIISISTKVTGITESSLIPETSPIDISTAGSSSISFVPSITSNVTQLTTITSTAEPATGTPFTTQSPPSSQKTDAGTTEIISISTKVTGITETSQVPETSPIDISTAVSSSISFLPSITSKVTTLTAITSTAEPATRTRFITTFVPSSHKTDSRTTKIISVSTNVTRITVSSIAPGTSPIEFSTAGPSSISFVPSITSNVTKLTTVTSTTELVTGTRFTTQSPPSSHKAFSTTKEIISASTKVTGISISSLVPETSPIDISTAGSSSFSFVPSITSNVTQLTEITSTAEPATGTRFTTTFAPSSHKTDSGTTKIISISTKVTEITESSPVPETSPIDISTAGSSSISFVPSITSNVTKLTAITSTAEPATRTRFITTFVPSSHKTDSRTTKIISISTKVTGITESSLVPETSSIDISTAGSSSISFVPSITSNVTKRTVSTSTAEPATSTRFTTQSPPSSHKTDSGTTEIILISTKVTEITESSLGTKNTGTTTILSASTKVTEITISSVLPESTTALVTISTQTQGVISTDSSTSYETKVTTGTPTSSPNDTCACCERRAHGHLVVMASVNKKKCTTKAPVISSKTPGFNITDISTTVRPEITPKKNNTITTTETPTSSPKNEICCEGRAHGHLVVVASVIEEDSPLCKETTDTANNTEITRSLSAVITTPVNITPLPEVRTNPVINATDWVTPIPEAKTTTSNELPCNKEGCCETRLHGHLVVFARIISE